MKLWSLPIKACAAVLLIAAAASAQTADKPVKPPSADTARSCFRGADVTSWSDVDRETINILVGVRDYYQIKLIGPCGDIDFNSRIGLRSRGSDFICSDVDAEVVANSPLGPLTCPASSIRKLTPDEVKALPSRQKP